MQVPTFSCRRAPIALSAVVLGLLALQAPASGSAAASVPNDERAIAHALNRLAFGAGPGDVDDIKRIGFAAWIDRQLEPQKIADAAIDAKLGRLTTLELDAATLAREYFGPARAERRRLQQANAKRATDQPGMNEPAASGAPGIQGPRGPMTEAARRARQVFSDLAEAKLLRAVYSERQLEEVLVDFWFNHFNVFGRKGQTELYVTEYERDAIRPHVLGNFRDLLEATAKSPAMLFYLDNWMSTSPDAMPLASGRGARGQSTAHGPQSIVVNSPRSTVRRRSTVGPQSGSSPRAGLPETGATNAPQQPQRRRGLNENYARELLELHTLGVDGGYTQQDVVEVARALTGWTIGQPRGGGGFRFAAALHDRGEKRVLGHVIPAGGGIEDGRRVLDIVATHPSTAKHIAFKLAQRFVSDTPPPALVERAAARFRETKGDLREVVRTIITSPEFFAPAAYQAKVKTPFEFVVSALRATGAEVSSGVPVARALAAMGMPLYLCQPPTGYDETAETWISAGALVNRLNFAMELAGNRLRGVRVPAAADADIAKVIGAPEFQKQ